MCRERKLSNHPTRTQQRTYRTDTLNGFLLVLFEGRDFITKLEFDKGLEEAVALKKWAKGEAARIKEYFVKNRLVFESKCWLVQDGVSFEHRYVLDEAGRHLIRRICRRDAYATQLKREMNREDMRKEKSFAREQSSKKKHPKIVHGNAYKTLLQTLFEDNLSGFYEAEVFLKTLYDFLYAEWCASIEWVEAEVRGKVKRGFVGEPTQKKASLLLNKMLRLKLLKKNVTRIGKKDYERISLTESGIRYCLASEIEVQRKSKEQKFVDVEKVIRRVIASGSLKKPILPRGLRRAKKICAAFV